MRLLMGLMSLSKEGALLKITNLKTKASFTILGEHMNTSGKVLAIATVLSCLSVSIESEAQPVNRGYLDSVEEFQTFYGSVRVMGWACMAGINQSIDVHVFVGGRAGDYGFLVGHGAANQSSGTDINTACSNTHYANRFTLDLASGIERFGGKRVWVHGVNTMGGINTPIINSGVLEIPYPAIIPYPYSSPIGLNATITPIDATLESHTITWSPVTGATHYQVFASTYDGDFQEWIAAGTTFNRPFVVTQYDKYHRYMVRSCGTSGCGVYGGSAFVKSPLY